MCVLWDSGGSWSIIANDTFKSLGLPGHKINCNVATISGKSKADVACKVPIITSDGSIVDVEAVVVDSAPKFQPARSTAVPVRWQDRLGGESFQVKRDQLVLIIGINHAAMFPRVIDTDDRMNMVLLQSRLTGKFLVTGQVHPPTHGTVHETVSNFCAPAGDQPGGRSTNEVAGVKVTAKNEAKSGGLPGGGIPLHQSSQEERPGGTRSEIQVGSGKNRKAKETGPNGTRRRGETLSNGTERRGATLSNGAAEEGSKKHTLPGRHAEEQVGHEDVSPVPEAAVCCNFFQLSSPDLVEDFDTDAIQIDMNTIEANVEQLDPSTLRTEDVNFLKNYSIENIVTEPICSACRKKQSPGLANGITMVDQWYYENSFYTKGVGYTAPILYTDEVDKLDDNYDNALKRFLALERKVNKKGNEYIKTAMNDSISEFLANGYVKETGQLEKEHVGFNKPVSYTHLRAHET